MKKGGREERKKKGGKKEKKIAALGPEIELRYQSVFLKIKIRQDA